MKPLNRRTLLKGIGSSIALPWLEAMSSYHAPGFESRGEATMTRRPKRIALMYIPNGVIGDRWFPSRQGSKFELTPSLGGLQPHAADLVMINGLDRRYVAGADPHSQCASCWLTSSLPSSSVDGATPINTTLDQIIARQVGHQTPFPSLELSCNQFNDNMEPRIFDAISWYGPGHDASSENDPRKVFRRLFGESPRIQQSVLDTVVDEAKSLQRSLGAADRRKVDEYLHCVRSLETRMEKQSSRGFQARQRTTFQLPDPLPVNRSEYIRLMGDLMVLAFQTDMTRVATLMVGPERWETPQLYDGVFDHPVDHHVMTHDRSRDEQVARIDRFHVDQYAYLIQRMKECQEGDSTLLDSTFFVLGSGLGDGARHSYRNLPLIIAGKGGSRIQTGRQIQCSDATPLANLWLSLARQMGVATDRYADSSGALTEYTG